MLEIKNTEIWGLERSLQASGNPMSIGEIDTSNRNYRLIGNESIANLNPDFKRAKKLFSNPVGSAHDHALLGIHVQFDIKYPQYWTIEAERYHNFEIISSQSKMHKLTMMGRGKDFENMFNKYVDYESIEWVQRYIDKYNETINTNSEFEEHDSYYWFMKALSNLPMGFEMYMTCDLTYLQIKTIYEQRKNHKLKEDWKPFCDWALSLPYFAELIGVSK